MLATRLLLLLGLGAAMAGAPGAYASAHHHSGEAGKPSKQRCVHNGVHMNRAGHANCGLHKGSGGSTGDEGGSGGSTGDEGDAL
jgi:hypothetical protein